MANSYRDNIKAKDKQKSQQKDLETLLGMLNLKGFQTNKGSNTYMLASTVVDFINKVIDQRQNDLSILSLWDTQDLSALVPLLYDRYRLYNERHQPKIYDIKNLYLKDQLEYFKPVPSYQKLVCFDPKNELACLAFTKTIIIARLDNITPTPLGIEYDELFAGSQLLLNGKGSGDREFFESYTSEFGVHQERDYIILPNETGEAVFYPITDFRQYSEKTDDSMSLTLLVRPNDMRDYGEDIQFPLVKDYVEITPDLLRFTLTQLMQNFAKFRGMSLQELAEFVVYRYQVDHKLTEEELVVDASTAILQEIREFADRNLGYPDKIKNVKIVEPRVFKVNTVIEEHTLNQKLQKYLEDNLAKFEDIAKLKERVYQLVDMFYAVTFGLDANFAKSQTPCTIEVTELTKDEESTDTFVSEKWATVTVTSHKLTEEEEFWRTRL